MQTLKEETKKAECKCSIEQRLAHVGARLDRVIARAQEKQTELKGRASNAVNDIAEALRKIREEFHEIREIASGASSKVAQDLSGKESAEPENGESAPCEQPKCAKHPIDTLDQAPNDDETPLW
jgi:hypothetical protein